MLKTDSQSASPRSLSIDSASTSLRSLNGDWNATQFFEELIANNKLAVAEGFTFCKVSGLEGFEEALHAMQSATAFCCVSDIADGYTELNNTPRTRRIKTVFLAMRHAIDDMNARNECMETMRELFRQLMSRLTLERVRIEQNCIYIDPRISFNEIDRFFFSGCACAYFQIAVDVYTDLRIDYGEWLDLRATYNIWLMGYDDGNRLRTVKFLCDNLGLGLNESKALVDSAPCKIASGKSQEDIDAFRKAIKNINYAKFKFVAYEQ